MCSSHCPTGTSRARNLAGYAGPMASIGTSLMRWAGAALRTLGGRSTRSPGSVRGRRPAQRDRASYPSPPRHRPGKSAGSASLGVYNPQPGDTADPGEIVWTWVPFEDDPQQGKDRPVLIIGHDDGTLLALMLTSRDRNNADSRDEGYVDIGSGPWDTLGRPSEVHLKRLLRIAPEDVRRIGSTLDRRLFDRVMSRLAR